MSSPEGNCIENLCQNCMEGVCLNIAESCTERCETTCQANCQDACNQACTNACNEACQSACSNVTCQCGTPSINIISMIIITTIIPFLTALGIGLIQAFDPQGPLFMTMFGSGILALSLSGVNISKFKHNSTCKVKKPEYASHLGFFVINHSHHPRLLIEKGHEFYIKGKYFCTGCYGLLLGTLIAIFIGLFYLFLDFSDPWLIIIGLVTPLCFLPIIMRYFIVKKPTTKLKLFSNALLPIGCCFLVIIMDSLYHMWIINVSTMIFILVAAYIRSIVAINDNEISEKK